MEDRKEKIEILSEMGGLLDLQRDLWLNHLLRLETLATAVDEVNKTVRALKTYSSEMRYLEDRVPLGTFRVSLPFNNPLYSFVLYTCGIALGGNRVLVRPSRATQGVATEFYNEFRSHFAKLGITLAAVSGRDFVDAACRQSEPGGLLFTGQVDNLCEIRHRFPRDQHLIYCGQGINPIVVGPNVRNMVQAVSTVVSSRIYNSGQDCLCSEKIFVHESIFDSFCNELERQLDDLTLGEFGDPCADVFPPVPTMRELVIDRFAAAEKEGRRLYDRFGLNVRVAAFEVPIDGVTIRQEKYCPLFTLARYRSDHDLSPFTKSEYKFGVTLLGGANASPWAEFPHVVTEGTVLDTESADAHIPFGGKGKSGFSACGDYFKEGPILYSVESTRSKK